MNDVSLMEITKALDLTPRRAQQLAKAGIFVKTERGRYDLCQSAIGYAHFLRRSGHREGILPASLSDISRCIGETFGNTCSLSQKGMFKKLEHGNYDLVESIRRYIEFQKTGWRGRGRPSCRGCGTFDLPFSGSGGAQL